MIPVFLSRPNPFTQNQLKFLDCLETFLTTQNLRSVTLIAKDYNPYESLSCINELVKRCYGIIIVALGQSYIGNGLSKKGAVHDTRFFDAEEKKMDDLWITSPFCHIEGAIAFSNKIPLLIIEQENIKIEGVLKHGTHAIHCPPITIDENDNWYSYFHSENFLIAFTAWSKKVSELYDFIRVDSH